MQWFCSKRIPSNLRQWICFISWLNRFIRFNRSPLFSTQIQMVLIQSEGFRRSTDIFKVTFSGSGRDLSLYSSSLNKKQIEKDKWTIIFWLYSSCMTTEDRPTNQEKKKNTNKRNEQSGGSFGEFFEEGGDDLLMLLLLVEEGCENLLLLFLMVEDGC